MVSIPPGGDPYPGKVKYEGGKPWVLSYEAVVASLALGGWPEKHWPKAAAVIAAESNRAPNIYNTYKAGHFGLMQISKSAHPGFFNNDVSWMVPFLNAGEGYKIFQRQGWGAWEAATNGRYTGFLLQATAAVKSVQRKRLYPRTISLGDFYLNLYGKDKDAVLFMAAAPGLGAANKAIAGAVGAGGEALGNTIVESGGAVVETAGEIAAKMQSFGIFGAVELLVGAGKWLSDPSNWIRVAQVVTGGALLLAGVSIAARPVTAPALKAATAVPGVGSAVKAARKVAA